MDEGVRISADVLTAVRSRWLTDARLEPLTGGMNSRTWTVTAGKGGCGKHERWVAKLVPLDQHDPFTRGLQAATAVEAAGIPAGRPLLTRDGRDHLDLPAGVLALLRWVDGVPLSSGAQDQEQIGVTLGAAHVALRGTSDTSAGAFPRWLDPDAEHLVVEDWVRPAVRTALGDYRALDHSRLQLGLLHGDPVPEAFLRSLLQPDVCGLIDWSSAEYGPLLYDVASALMYVGGLQPGRVLLQAYGRVVDLPSANSSHELEVVLALRQAVQADYFARRLAGGDLTGVTDAADNRAGLHDAKAFFAVSE